MALRRDTSIQFIKGVGPKLADVFHRKGVKTVQDLIEFYPRAYEDRRAARQISSLKPGEIVSLKAQIFNVSSVNLGRTSRKMYDVVLKDNSGKIHCKYFRVPYRGYFERFKPGQEVRVVGKVLDYRGRIEFHHPDLRDIEPDEEVSDTLVPLYTEIEGLSTAKIQKIIQQAFSLTDDEFWGSEVLPDWILQKNNLLTKRKALVEIHKPDISFAREYIESNSPSHKRIIFEEFFWLELYLAARKSGLKKEKTEILDHSDELSKKLISALPFTLTGAQARAYQELIRDFRSGHPMHRLVQGDVGSGKTMVSFLAACYVVEAGKQVCLMAPTEILAEQHYKNAIQYLGQLKKKSGAEFKISYLSGTTKAAERKKTLEDLKSGAIDLLLGTHALIEDDVEFADLALVIIDEQHRFGVGQRSRLKNKGHHPHFLVMTATPIPRTLAMTVYGDLDVSIIDELPKGRSPIQTRAIFDSKRHQALDFMLEQIEKGRQAYIVYPLVEESEKIDLKNAVHEYEQLQKNFPKVRFALLHGQMKAVEKDEVMQKFREHQFDVLVSTTVIEVGVDVPNANIMIIEHAERFGLSQLHQLRGRVGRGTHKSFCILIMGYAVSDEGKLRTEYMEKTTDGFKIAEYDLEMRGPGEFMGTRQSGLAGFKMAHLVRDAKILYDAREAAFEVMRKDPYLKKAEHLALRAELLRAHGPTALAGIA